MAVRNTWGGVLGQRRSSGDTVKDRQRDQRISSGNGGDLWRSRGNGGDQRRYAGNGGGQDTNWALWLRARQAWMNWQKFRDQRHRVARYIHGDQWGDMVYDGRGHYVTERQRITDTIGAVPIQANYMVKYFTTMKGLYSKNFVLPTCFARQENADAKSTIMTNTLQTNCDNDNIQDILTQEYGELLKSGMACVCEEWCRIGAEDEEDSHTFEVNLDYIGIEDGGNDSQMRDISLFVEIRDYLPEDLATELSNENGRVIWTYEKIKEIYSKYLPYSYDYDTTQSVDKGKAVEWDTPLKGYCRTYRIWTKEKRLCYRCVDVMDKESPLFHIVKEDMPQVLEENRKRIELGMQSGMRVEDIPVIEVEEQPYWDTYYYLTIMTPDARVLLEKDNPYEHGDIPYTVCLYEYNDGDIVPFFANIIPQQRNYNRLLTQKDTMVQRALKDLKMVPYDCIPPNMSPKQFSEQFHVIGNTVFYKPSKSGAVPQIISSNSADVGINDLLAIHKQGMEEITNISEALQGQTPTSGTAASRYAMETENATTAIAGIVNKFSTFEKKVYEKKMKNIQQFYTHSRDVLPSQSNGFSDFAMYDPKEVGDIKFMIKIAKGSNTVIARMQEDSLAESLLQMGAISPEQRVELGWIPNKAKFLQVIQTNTEQGIGNSAGEPLNTMEPLNTKGAEGNLKTQ